MDGTVSMHSCYIVIYNRSFYFEVMTMKRLELERYNNKILNHLASQKNNPDFDKLVREIIFERVMMADYPYLYIYRKYKDSGGIEKLAYGDAVVEYFIDGKYFIEQKILDDILETTSFDRLMDLSTSDCELVRKRACNCLAKNYDVKLDDVGVRNKKIIKLKK